MASASNLGGVGLVEKSKTFWRRRRWILWTGGTAIALLAVVTVGVAILARRAEPFVRARIVEGLSRHFHSYVQLDSFHMSVGNGFRGEWGVWARGRGLRIWPPSQVAGVEVPKAPSGKPLIELTEFSFHAPLRYKSGQPIYISDIRLSGLRIDMPPRPHLDRALSDETSEPAPGTSSKPPIQIRIGNIECTNGDLVLETSKPGKLPKEFAIPRFKVTNVVPGLPMHFEAALTNPIPVGTIHTKGTFGPWQVSDPGESPLAGDYSFNNADLGTIKGIAGILNSTGHYAGTLRDITVDGVTDTPDFRLSNSDNTLALHTNFHAIVDGTNGDTWLDPVNATLGRSQVMAKGQVVRMLVPDDQGSPHSIGHDISLEINVSSGRIEDFLRVSTHGDTPVLTGNITLKTLLHIPPGPVPVVKKMTLTAGSFELTQAQFTSTKVQDRIVELSLRGQGRPHEAKTTPPDSVQSDMHGDFKLANGKLTLPNLVFTVPGVDVTLSGSYGLQGGTLDFAGVARMEATVSKVVGGWKGALLKPADRIFKKDGAGTAVPIHIRGTRKNPDFGIDLNRLKSTSPERPDTHPASPAVTPSSPPA
jgi:AsmA-like C-terminal region